MPTTFFDFQCLSQMSDDIMRRFDSLQMIGGNENTCVSSITKRDYNFSNATRFQQQDSIHGNDAQIIVTFQRCQQIPMLFLTQSCPRVWFILQSIVNSVQHSRFVMVVCFVFRADFSISWR